MAKLYQEETEKALKNFQITSRPADINLIHSISIVKSACAMTNVQIGRLDKSIGDKVIKYAQEIAQGKYDDQFKTDSIQGGAGTSLNMNVNEVIASLVSLECKQIIHPLDHVNMGQSTNDVVPTAIKLMLIEKIDDLVTASESLAKELQNKADEFKDIIKVARTHLQDAVPMTLGQSFGAYANAVRRNLARLDDLKVNLMKTNLGGTAIGSMTNSCEEFVKEVNRHLSNITGYEFKPSTDLIDATQNTDDLLYVAYGLKTYATIINKMCNDMRLLSSGPRAGIGELKIPVLQKGSSIMPGKHNPVILEMMNQICYQVFGNVETCFHASLNSQLELNVMLPVFVKNIVEAFDIFTKGIEDLRTKVIQNIEPDKDRINYLYSYSLVSATDLVKKYGYDTVTKLVNQASKNGTTLQEELEKRESSG